MRKKENTNYTVSGRKGDFTVSAGTKKHVGTIDQSQSISSISRCFSPKNPLDRGSVNFRVRENFPATGRVFPAFLFVPYIFVRKRDEACPQQEVDEKFQSRLQRHKLAVLSIDVNPLALPLPILGK